MTEEIWKDIEGYEGIYQVSSFGRVRSLDRVTIRKNSCRLASRGKILRPVTLKNGYESVCLVKDGRTIRHYVHRLVAKSFVYGYKDGLVVNHKDESRNNNIASNLEWVTVRENAMYRNAQKRRVYRDKRRIPVRQLDKEGNEIARYDSMAEAARHIVIPRDAIFCAVHHFRGRKRAGGFYWERI